MKRKWYMLLTCIGLILGITGTSIYASTEVSVENEFTTGVVDIDLNEYTIENGREVEWTDNVKNILPGQDICKIPRISNQGNDCYVRARIEFVDTPLRFDSLYGMTDEWILGKDGYCYYRRILGSGDTVDLFKGIKVPIDLKEDTAESLFQIRIYVDAIQSDYFTPDYALDHPWGQIEILDCKKEGMYDFSTFKKQNNLNFKITYEGKVGKLIKNEDDFFENFPVMLPGGVYSDVLEFENNSDEKIHLYFRTGVLERTDLLEQVHLKIIKQNRENQTVIYEGAVHGTDLEKNMLLETLNPGEIGKLRYEISVPKELDNTYTLMREQVTWVFSTEPVQEIDSVPTGDSSLIFCLIMMVTGVIFLVIGFILNMNEKARKRNGKA